MHTSILVERVLGEGDRIGKIKVGSPCQRGYVKNSAESIIELALQFLLARLSINKNIFLEFSSFSPGSDESVSITSTNG